ncbi:MAG: type VI secretion system tip protein VgrG [Pseudomonadaceae bacterium]|nr:type VI secretion system tip protein VgrG [Pseudomonadaceae bacterium]HCP53534.1 type VI secretion system tip protein VgrG [Pseudomonas sp.]
MFNPSNETHFSVQIQGLQHDFQVLGFTGTEAISTPYQFLIELVSETPDFDLGQLLHRQVFLAFDPAGNGIHGQVYQVSQGDSGKRLHRYAMVLVPHVAYLQHSSDQRIFQNLTVEQIISQVLEAHGILGTAYRFDLGPTVYPKRVYCVQYDETDLHFIQRLCEEEGIHYHFEHSPDGHLMVFADDQTFFRKLDKPTPYQQDSGMVADEPVIKSFALRMEARTQRTTRRDYNFEKPRLLLEADDSPLNNGAEPDLEDYAYPAGVYDRDRCRHLSQRALERHRADYALVEGRGDDPQLCSGYFLRLSDHPRSEWNDLWLLTSLVHEGKQPQVLEEHITSDTTANAEDFHQGYRNRFTATPWDVFFRPSRIHMKPKVLGNQTAVVTGPAGEEIHCDEYGRVKVQFHWDRLGQGNDKSSCWLRLSSTWAGKRYGSVVIPRIGMEVLVSFFEGDPDQPIISGCLYHKRHNTAYVLPANKPRSSFKTLSSPGGGGFNELRIEDKKGEEQIFVHAARDWDQHIKHDQSITVGNERHDAVTANSYSEFKAQEQLTIDLARKVEAKASDHLSVSQTQHIKAGTALLTRAGREVHLYAGDKVVAEAAIELTAKAGGSFLKLDPSGISMVGPTIRINAGGKPGKGSGIYVLGAQIPGVADVVAAGALLNAPKANALQAVPAPVKALIEEEEEEEELEQRNITLRVGVFFDGTGNNRSNSEQAANCRAQDVNLTDMGEDIQAFCEEHGFDSKGSVPDDSYGNDVSNIARLYKLYPDDVSNVIGGKDIAYLSVYIDGIGTSSGEDDSIYAQGTGQGEQGVLARVEQAPEEILEALGQFASLNKEIQINKVEFDVFGFSRGAAAARHFANEIVKGHHGVLSKGIPSGMGVFSKAFDWEGKANVSINYIGLFDTVAAIVDPLVGDFSGHNKINTGVNLYLAPSIATKIVQLVAKDEYRYNFSLNSAGAADIVLPGAHSDLGGGYLPNSTEHVLLAKPQRSLVNQHTPITAAPSYLYAQKAIAELEVRLRPYKLPFQVRAWEIQADRFAKGDRFKGRYVYAAPSSEREVSSDLALVYFRIMRELAVQNKVPFNEVDHGDPTLVLPTELEAISEKLTAYALGQSSVANLTSEEIAVLYQRYIHMSANWNAAKGANTSSFDVVFINRPTDNYKRMVFENE